MKSPILCGAGMLALTGALSAASGLYYMGEDAQESIPLKWSVGLDFIWDDNVNPTLLPGSPGYEDDATGVTPYVECAFVNITPQTTIDLFARLGAMYYFDEPEGLGDDFYSDSKVGLNLTHRFNERVRLVSRNYIAYELEPDYTYGFANDRQAGEYLYWTTDNALGVRWTERMATYTGFNLYSIDYDDVVENQDRFTWTVYNDFRFVVSPQTVATFSYRYSETDGDGVASDSTNHYILAGVEHRFSPTMIGIVRAGAQLREVDGPGGEDSCSPYVEAMFRAQINEQFSLRSFLRYGIEDYDTVQWVPPVLVEYDERTVLRIGLSGDYAVSDRLNLFGGVDYIMSDYDSGRIAGTAVAFGGNPDEDLINLYIGMSMRLNEWLYAQASYNYTDSSSDLLGRDYDRNRLSLGMRAEF